MSHDFPLVLTRKWESQRKSENSSNGELVPYCTGWLLLVRAHNPAPITSNSHTKSVTKQDSAAKALHTFSSNWSHPSFTVSHSLAEGFFFCELVHFSSVMNILARNLHKERPLYQCSEKIHCKFLWFYDRSVEPNMKCWRTVVDKEGGDWKYGCAVSLPGLLVSQCCSLVKQVLKSENLPCIIYLSRPSFLLWRGATAVHKVHHRVDPSRLSSRIYLVSSCYWIYRFILVQKKKVNWESQFGINSIFFSSIVGWKDPSFPFLNLLMWRLLLVWIVVFYYDSHWR